MKQQTDLEQGNAATREDVTRAQGELSELRKQREALAGELTEQKVRRMALSKERDAVYAEQRRFGFGAPRPNRTTPLRWSAKQRRPRLR